nr:MAG: DNA pilot protein [Microvirus sp.]
MDWGSIIGGGITAAGGIAQALMGQQGSGHSYQYYLDRQYNQQQRLAQDQPSWLVEGAKRAGLHPLAVLGMNPGSGGSISMGDTGSNYQDTSWLNDVGQGIGRAAGALVDRKTRAQQDQFNQVQMQQKLENNDLQNQLLRAQIRQYGVDDAVATLANGARMAITHQQQNPPFPVGRNGAVIDGQADSTTSQLFKVKPPEIFANDPQTSFAEAGSHPEIKWTRTALGGYSPVRSQAVEEALEDDYLGGLTFNIRNRMGASFSDPRFAPPRKYLPDGGKSGRYYWLFDNISGDWFAADALESKFSKLKKTLLGR